MEEIIKEVVAPFVKSTAGQINSSTKIDSKAVNSSIQLHRMYAKLAEQGIQVENYRQIQTFGELIQAISQNRSNGEQTPVISSKNNYANQDFSQAGSALSVGIDIEPITSFPVVNDFREDEFYKMNFAPSEIAYCILQKNPYASFAGLFASKEAIVKANNAYLNTTFNAIVIDHSSEGRPIHPDFQLSIAHSDDLVVAVAIQMAAISSNQLSVLSMDANANRSGLSLTALVAIILALISIAFHLFYFYRA